MNRAERRRADREAGRHRSAKKKGRRSNVRAASDKAMPQYEALEASGFAIANQRVWTPGERVQ